MAKWWHCDPPNEPTEDGTWVCECKQTWEWHPEYGNVWIPSDLVAQYEQAARDAEALPASEGTDS